MSGCIRSGRNYEQRSRPGRYSSIWELMHYVKVLRYIPSKPVRVWYYLEVIYQRMEALWRCDHVSVTISLDGGGEDAGDQSARAVC